MISHRKAGVLRLKNILIFDSTLRDGAQAEGISFSVDDKLKIAKALDDFGVPYIEAGNPGSNPKDLEFFERVKSISFKQAKLCAFGSTRRNGIAARDDKNVQALLQAETDVVVIFGKCWDFHVTEILHATLPENLDMIADTISYLKSLGKEVIFDGEHFFDGYKANPEYALQALQSAVNAGADCLCLCDTNGGAFPNEIFDVVTLVQERFDVSIGIHCHNDCGMAVANSIQAVAAGANHVQGTFIGFGERCGNANLSTIIPNLQLKQDYACVPADSMAQLIKTARLVAEVSNLALSDKEPYVGRSAFAHKGGMHIDAVAKASSSFEHIEPQTVGGKRKFLTSEVAGRSSILAQIQKIAPHITKTSPETAQIMAKLKAQEHEGYQFEGAESTFELLIRKQLGKYKPFFELENFKIISEHPYCEKASASALIKVVVDGKAEITAAEGQGPVHALDRALRRALCNFYPALCTMRLVDYKVRVMDSESATAARVRVLIESTDGSDNWTTVGVSHDIIEASWLALVDSIEYKLIKDMESQGG